MAKIPSVECPVGEWTEVLAAGFSEFTIQAFNNDIEFQTHTVEPLSTDRGIAVYRKVAAEWFENLDTSDKVWARPLIADPAARPALVVAEGKA